VSGKKKAPRKEEDRGGRGFLPAAVRGVTFWPHKIKEVRTKGFKK